MNLLLLLSFCTNDDEQELLKLSKCGLQNSIIAFQRNLLDGFRCNSSINLEVINYSPVGSFPKHFRKVYLKGSRTIQDGVVINNMGFINLPIVKQLYLKFAVKNKVKSWIKKHKNEKIAILQYDLLRPYLMAQTSLKKYNKDVITSSIIADLPNEYGYPKSERWVKGYIKKMIGKDSILRVRKLDCYGFLTDQMSALFHVPSNRYIVVEGFANDERYFNVNKEAFTSQKKIIQYFGSLFKIYGIENLLKAFSQINNPLYELWICGVGDGLQLVKQYAEIDKRIKYLGYRSQEEISKLESFATVLVNPRQNNGEYTKYSFPSKIIEYMTVGRPVIAYKLDGIPKIYYDFLISPKDNSVDSLKETIIDVCELDVEQRYTIGVRNRNFVISRTQKQIVANKIIRLIKSQM